MLKMKTEIATIRATTDINLLPVAYYLVDGEPFFKINATTGIITLVKSILLTVRSFISL